MKELGPTVLRLLAMLVLGLAGLGALKLWGWVYRWAAQWWSEG